MKSYIKILVTLAILPLVSGCVFAAVTGATAIGTAMAQERTVGNAVDDTNIWTKIKSDMLQADVNELLLHVTVKVNEGKVLLTGVVEDPETMAKAVQIAWSQRGVREVINDIEIADGKKRYPIVDYGSDTLITTQVKAKMLSDKQVHSINYTVHTVNGVVYLMGIAQDEQELEVVKYIAGSVRNVKKVANYVRVKDVYDTSGPSQSSYGNYGNDKVKEVELKDDY